MGKSIKTNKVSKSTADIDSKNKAKETLKLDLNMKLRSVYDTELDCRVVIFKITDDFRRILNTFMVGDEPSKYFSTRQLNPETKVIDIVSTKRYPIKKEVIGYINRGNSLVEYVLYELFKDKKQKEFTYVVDFISDARLIMNIFAHFVKYIVKLNIDRSIVLETTLITDSEQINDI